MHNIADVMQMPETYHDLWKPRRSYAIRFSLGEGPRGLYLLLNNATQLGCLRGNIFIIGEPELKLLEKAGVSYEVYPKRPVSASDIWRYFGVEEETQRKTCSLFTRIMNSIKGIRDASD